MIKADSIRTQILMSLVFLTLSACVTAQYTPEDLALQREVKEAIQFSPEMSSHIVYVFVHDGVVTLQGSVKSGFERWVAEKTARRVEGVTQVYNHIQYESRRRR